MAKSKRAREGKKEEDKRPEDYHRVLFRKVVDEEAHAFVGEISGQTQDLIRASFGEAKGLTKEERKKFLKERGMQVFKEARVERVVSQAKGRGDERKRRGRQVEAMNKHCKNSRGEEIDFM